MPTQDTQSRNATSFEIKIQDQTYTQAETQGVQALVIEDHVDMVAMLTLEIGGAEGQPAWNVEIGQEIEAKVGGKTSTLFKGHVTALEPAWDAAGGARLVIRALDPLHKLGRGRKTRTFLDMTDSAIVSAVASECDLSVDADSTSETHKYVLQRNESDIAFLKRLAARNNCHLRLEQGSLVFKKNEYSGEEITLTLGQNVQALRISANTADLADKVVVLGWDPAAKDKVEGSASSVPGIGAGSIGITLAREKFGDHWTYVTDVPVTTASLATAIAEAELERIARQFVRGTGTIYGDDRVRAGANVVLEGFGTPWNGKYYVMASRHVISAQTAYTTEFTFCSNSFGSSA